MRDLRIDDRSLACNLNAIIAQRLVRRLCLDCREFRDLSDEERLLFESEGLRPPEQIAYPVGCDACRDRGYRDLIGIFETVRVDDGLSTAIQFQHCEKDIRTLLRGSGVASLLSDGLQKAASGITTIEEIMNMSCMPLRINGNTA